MRPLGLTLHATLLTAVLCTVLGTVLGTTLHAQESDPQPERGQALYQRLCATCHGEAGGGDGPLAYLLDPAPRDFGLATFHVVSTENRLPSDDDLLDTLRLGMVGTAMPGWSHLPEADLRALVAHLREMMVERRIEDALRGSTAPSAEERAGLELAVREELAPGARVPIGPAPPSTPESLARGREVWMASCAECHGESGSGHVRNDLMDIRGAPSRARDMTAGLFRGSDEPVELARRISLGMPGTAMPSFDLPPEDLWAVVHYVRSMVKSGAQQDMLQIRRTVVAPRLMMPLEDVAGIDWQFVPKVRLPLMPYVWDGNDVGPLELQVVHDGTRFAVAVHWAAAPPRSGHADRAPPVITVEVSADAEPPLVSGPDDSLRMLRWKAAEADEEGRYGRGTGQWADGTWEVVLDDTLEADRSTDPSFLPGETIRLQISFRAGDSSTRAMTLWHALELAP